MFTSRSLFGYKGVLRSSVPLWRPERKKIYAYQKVKGIPAKSYNPRRPPSSGGLVPSRRALTGALVAQGVAVVAEGEDFDGFAGG